MYTYVYVSLSLSLYIYIYIYICGCFPVEIPEVLIESLDEYSMGRWSLEV